MPNHTFTIGNKKHTVQGTAFQIKVWEEILKIPRGDTISYSELAIRIKSPRAVRAVANACGANKLLESIPCHRVIAKDGSLGGYAKGKQRKNELLKLERAPSTPPVRSPGNG